MNYNELFIADFEAGTLTWKTRPREHFATDRAFKAWNTQYAGKNAGTDTSDGYRVVNLKGKIHKLHRILYAMKYGPIPAGKEIDHIDGTRKHNAIGNLRLATSSQNKMNASTYRNNRSGQKGVGWNKEKSKWKARIQVNGRIIYLGLFDTLSEATGVRLAAELTHHGSFARTK